MDSNPELHSARNSNDPNGSNTFFQTYRPQSPPAMPPGPSSSAEDRAAKRRSIFTVSSALPTNVSESNSQTLMNLASEVNSLTSLDRKPIQESINEETRRKRRSVEHGKQADDDSFSSTADPSACLLTPPSTPMKSSEMDASGNISKKHRHNSLENIHRPKNHRSSAKSSKSRQKRSKGTTVVPAGDEKYVVRSEHQCYLEIKSSEKWLVSDGKRMNLACRAATAFAMGSVRKLKADVVKLKEENMKRRTESAARLIMHTMLLNSWRTCRKQNEKLQKENGLHLRSIENMCLQLRVIRQMHREEKDKSQSRSLEVSSMSIQMAELKRERDKMQAELERAENELNSCHVYMETLTNKNAELVQTKMELQRALVMMEEEKQEEQKKLARIEMDNIRSQETLQDMRRQLNEESKLRLKWQEEARAKESQLHALRSDVEIRDKNLEQVQSSYQELKREVATHKEAAERMKREEEQLRTQLAASTDEILKLTEKLECSEEEMRAKERLAEKMRLLAEEKEEAIAAVRENLSLFLGDGVIRRRRWANAFHYLVFPLDIFREIFNMPRDHAASYMVDLKEINA